MHFSRTLLNLVALTIALSCSGQAFANQAATPATPPAEAVVAPSECLTPDVVVGNILSGVPDAEIKELRQGPPPAIVFTSPSMPTDFVVEFNENGCRINSYAVTKINT
jgi:hypothetical protein